MTDEINSELLKYRTIKSFDSLVLIFTKCINDGNHTRNVREILVLGTYLIGENAGKLKSKSRYNRYDVVDWGITSIILGKLLGEISALPYMWHNFSNKGIFCTSRRRELRGGTI